MIVRAVVRPVGASWPTVGEQYPVLEVFVGLTKEPLYRIERDDGTPVLANASEFELVDGSVPASWEVHVNQQSGSLTLGPPAWHELGFWERFFDLDAEAKRAYERYKGKRS